MKPCLSLNTAGTELQIPLLLATGTNATVSKMLIALQTERGKWTDDDTFGLPWQTISTKTNLEIEALVRSLIAAVSGVLSVNSVSVSRENGLANIALNVTISSDDGPFIVEVGALEQAGQYPQTWYNTMGLNFGDFC